MYIEEVDVELEEVLDVDVDNVDDRIVAVDILDNVDDVFVVVDTIEFVDSM